MHYRKWPIRIDYLSKTRKDLKYLTFILLIVDGGKKINVFNQDTQYIFIFLTQIIMRVIWKYQIHAIHTHVFINWIKIMFMEISKLNIHNNKILFGQMLLLISCEYSFIVEKTFFEVRMASIILCCYRCSFVDIAGDPNPDILK